MSNMDTVHIQNAAEKKAWTIFALLNVFGEACQSVMCMTVVLHISFKLQMSIE